MKFQKLFVFGTLMCAALIFAGCGNTDKASGSGDSGGGGSATSNEDGGTSGGSDTSSTVTTGDFQLVSLNVPAMTWGGCKRSVRDALAKVEGIDSDSIDTDSAPLKVSFKAKQGFDLDASLADYADHDHLKGWSLAE